MKQNKRPISPAEQISPNTKAYWCSYWADKARAEAEHPAGVAAGPPHLSVLQAFILRVKDGTVKGGRMLEIGCGNSRIAETLGNVQYTGIDIAENSVTMAKAGILRRRAAGECMTSSYSFIVADATMPLPLNRATFDVAISIGTFHLFGRHIVTALQNTARVMKSGAVLIFEIYHPDSIGQNNKFEQNGYSKVETPIGILLTKPDDEMIRCNESHLKEALSQSSFQPLEIRAWGRNESQLNLIKTDPNASDLNLFPVEFNYFSVVTALRK